MNTNAKVLYVTSDCQSGHVVQKEFIKRCNGEGDDVCMTLNLLGISGLESQKKRGFNVLFVDFSVIESSVERGIKAIKAFFKKDPENPIVIFCDDQKQLLRVIRDRRIEDVTPHVFEKGSDKDLQMVCDIVAGSVEA